MTTKVVLGNWGNCGVNHWSVRHIILRQPASPEREICWKSWDRIWPASEFYINWIFLFKYIFFHICHLKQFELLVSSFFICVNIYPCFLISPDFPWAQHFQNCILFWIWSDLSCGAVITQLLHLHLVYHCFSFTYSFTYSNSSCSVFIYPWISKLLNFEAIWASRLIY